MSLRERRVRFFGLMAVLAVLLSVSVIGCCCLHGKGQTQNISICLCKKGIVDDGDYPSPGRFVGVVTNKNTGAGIPGAQMAFDGPSDATINRNSNGSYTSPWLNPGTYAITVTASGYQTISESGVTLNSGQTKTKNYQMTPQ